MNDIIFNAALLSDGYKTGHHQQYPDLTQLVYSNFTPRSNKHGPKGVSYLVSFSQQMAMKQIHEAFNTGFFNRPKIEVCSEIKRELSLYLNTDYDVSHFEALWELGYLPITVSIIPEGEIVPMRVPVLTIYNTKHEFYWVTNYLETILSQLLWKGMTSATIARKYRSVLSEWQRKTDVSNAAFVDFQGHDFSMRGMDSPSATIASSLGHLTSFKGSDSLPSIFGARKYYNETGFVCGSVNATEHSVMCAGTKEDEIGTFKRLLDIYPTGILSIVSDTWDLWTVLTDYLPKMKSDIMARDGKVVIRPDSGDPVDIICGTANSQYEKIDDFSWELHGKDLNSWLEDMLLEEVQSSTAHGDCGPMAYTGYYNMDGKYVKATITNTTWGMYGPANIEVEYMELAPADKGVIELLWDEFGGTVNSQGYKVLDSHIGAIYGDSITIERANEICRRLVEKGFASTNVVLGIGSFTYQFNTRDTFGFAMKATYVEIDGKGLEIFKDPVTDDGIKKSARGLLQVVRGENGLELIDGVSWDDAINHSELRLLYKDGTFFNETTLTEIRERLSKYEDINV